MPVAKLILWCPWNCNISIKNSLRMSWVLFIYNYQQVGRTLNLSVLPVLVQVTLSIPISRFVLQTERQWHPLWGTNYKIAVTWNTTICYMGGKTWRKDHEHARRINRGRTISAAIRKRLEVASLYAQDCTYYIQVAGLFQLGTHVVKITRNTSFVVCKIKVAIV